MIDTKALRSRVLDLAIRGKLTEQLPSDGTAEELYQQIQAEKPKGSKAKKPYTTSSQLPFDIPPNWYSCTIDSINGFVSKTTNPLNNRDATYELYSVPNYPLKKPEILKGGDIGSAKQLLQENDVLVCKINPRINRVWIVTRHTDHTIIGSSEWIPFRNNHIDSQYLCYYFQSPFFRTYMQSNLSGVGGSLTRAKPEFVKQYPIILPPLAEQKRIVERVEEIFRLLDTIDQAQEKYSADAESLKAKLITAGIQGKLTEQLDSDGTAEELHQQIQEEKKKLIKEGKIKKEKPLPAIKDEEIPFEIPGNWKWVRLGSLLHGVTDGPHYSPKYIDSGIPFISTRNIANGKLDFSSAKYISPELHEELCKRCKPKKGDVLYSKGGTTGIAVVNDSDIEFNVWVHVAVLSMGANVNSYYLAMALNSPHCYGQSQEYTKGTANRDLGLTRMVKITLPLPPLAEQKRIAEVLERVAGVLAVK